MEDLVVVKKVHTPLGNKSVVVVVDCWVYLEKRSIIISHEKQNAVSLGYC
jgi:hypothetical protein